MSARTAAISLALLTCGYATALIWIESRRGLVGLDELAAALPVMLALTTTGWMARFGRWQWLMRRAGHRLSPARAMLAYLAGFAFTATPGKVGELVRVRYFAAQGVPASRVLSAFIYERAWDLVVVLGLATVAFQDSVLMRTASLFVACVVLAVAVAVLSPAPLSAIAVRLERKGLQRGARLLHVLRDGLAGCRQWMNPVDLLVSASLGIVAWSVTSLALVWLVRSMSFELSTVELFSIYPLAMLVGAASMLPGGVGTTEAAIAALLATDGVPWDAGVITALGVRLVTLWWAVAVGLLALTRLEYQRAVRRSSIEDGQSPWNDRIGP